MGFCIHPFEIASKRQSSKKLPWEQLYLVSFCQSIIHAVIMSVGKIIGAYLISLYDIRDNARRWPGS